MEGDRRNKTRRTFRWPKEARALVRILLHAQRTQREGTASSSELGTLITKLAAVSGNPRDACWRFARQYGIVGKRTYQDWPPSAQQTLLNLIGVFPLQEVAIMMRRTPGSIRSMLYRLGAGAKMGQDWFTKGTLAQALHIRVEEVERWVKLGWLKPRVVHTGKLQREIIGADDFCDFCKRHSREVAGRRLNLARLNFVRDFVFPSSHAELLPVRESKKERAAYKEQKTKRLPSGVAADEFDEDPAASA